MRLADILHLQARLKSSGTLTRPGEFRRPVRSPLRSDGTNRDEEARDVRGRAAALTATLQQSPSRGGWTYVHVRLLERVG
jgi:hypothetical protein